ncbi:MAG: NAD+ synthase [Candidatus Thermoplasmatota archaeon]|nr:NAD+ synthase [Candidatus Thermoplasmatota archaeon]
MTIVALLQLDHTVGDIDANVKSIENAVGIAQENGADLAVSSELAISGYPPRDLLEKHGFVRQCIEATKSIQVSIPTIVGTPIPPEAERTKPGNGAVRIIPDRPTRVVTQKQLLPTYDVFDEERYFHSDSKPGILRLLDGQNIGVTICEDAWQHAGLVPSDYSVDPIEQLSSFSIDGETLKMSLNLSSSPYHIEKQDTRAEVARCAAKTLEHPFLLCNQVGANDDLIFDGRSLIAWPDGYMIQAPAWKEGILLIDIEKRSGKFLLLNEEDVIDCEIFDGEPTIISRYTELLEAITVGVRDYCRKSGLESVVLGMSGGIDSAVSAAICVRALGSKNVVGISMPSRHSSDHSISDAEFTAEKLGMELLSMSIEEIHHSAESTLIHELEKGHSVAAENIQSRLRGMLVMGVANARGAMAIATGNKSELAMGYCTLYGDMAGGYSPLGDVWKTEVYELAKAINNEAKSSGRDEPINESTMTKPPSAELAPEQTDQDSLPPYEVLDSILKLHMEEGLDADAISGFTGLNITLISDLLLRFANNEHKRWQMSPSPRVSKRAFGQGWRQPLAAKKN